MSGPTKDSRLFKVSISTRRHHQRASVIPIEYIVRSTHLIPKWPTSVLDTDWTSDNVYDKATTFYVNPYLRHDDFVRFEEARALPVQVRGQLRLCLSKAHFANAFY
jgi:hypothetical protein